MTAPTDPDRLDFAGLDRLFGYALRRAQGAVHRAYMAALGDIRLTQKQTAVMWLIESNPGVSQGAIGVELDVDRATMMTLVNRLEKRGLLRRRASSADRRRLELYATAAGRRLMKRARARIAAHEKQVRSHFTAAEQRTLTGLLQRLQSLEAAGSS